LGVVGISSALVQGLGLRYVAPRLGERMAVTIGVLSFLASAVLYTLAGSTAGVYFAIVVGGLQGFISPSISALASRAIEASSQGELQGATQAVGSIAAIIGPPLYALVFERFHGPGAIAQLPTMPFLLAAAFSAVTLALFLRGLAIARQTPPSPSARS
ncbi:MAG: hypothetical protein KDE30_09375, partial [Novosphingobium sp.]|nr:hypothetical protein [Novosphingobium sp.]